MKRIHFVSALFVLALINVMSTWSAYADFAIGGSVGASLPLGRDRQVDPGIAVEGFYRADPYELRFQYTDINLDIYSVALGRKHFFGSALARPYVEAAFGPLIVGHPGRSLAYGFRPEVAAGVDIGLNDNLSVGAVTRYFGLIYFGDTDAGWMEANHGFTLVGNVVLWF